MTLNSLNGSASISWTRDCIRGKDLSFCFY